MVRTAGFQSVNRSSTLRGVTIFKKRSDYKNVMSMHLDFCEQSEAKSSSAGDAPILRHPFVCSEPFVFGV